MFLTLVVYAVLYGIVFTNSALINYIHSYLFSFIAFIFIVFGTAVYFGSRSKLLELLKTAYVVITVFMTACYVIFFDGFETLKNLSTYLNITRTRSLFGFVQANTTADICIAALACGLILRVAKKNGLILYGRFFNWYCTFSHILMLIMLLSTSSRGAILALFALYACYWYQGLDEHIADQKAFRYIKPMCIGTFALMIAFYIYIEFIASGTIDLSYRFANFSVNIPTLIKEKRLWTGWGFVDKSVFANGRIISGTGYTDNYYLYVLTTTGILGCIIIMFYLATLIWGLHSRRKRLNGYGEVKLHHGVVSVLVMILTFSISQASFINPASVCSVMSMIILIGQIVLPKEKFVKTSYYGGSEN